VLARRRRAPTCAAQIFTSAASLRTWSSAAAAVAIGTPIACDPTSAAIVELEARRRRGAIAAVAELAADQGEDLGAG